jgi:hypothetical protein
MEVRVGWDAVRAERGRFGTSVGALPLALRHERFSFREEVN